MVNLRKIGRSTHFKYVSKEDSNEKKLIPCDPNDESAIKMSFQDISPQDIQIEPTSKVCMR